MIVREKDALPRRWVQLTPDLEFDRGYDRDTFKCQVRGCLYEAPGRVVRALSPAAGREFLLGHQRAMHNRWRDRRRRRFWRNVLTKPVRVPTRKWEADHR